MRTAAGPLVGRPRWELRQMPVSQSTSQEPQAAIADVKLGAANGFLMLALGLGLIALSGWFGIVQFTTGPAAISVLNLGLSAAGFIVSFFILNGLVVLQPNTSLVCLLFGSYSGTLRRAGFWWVNPFYSKNKVSRRLETLECGPLKVNDAVGNPIDIGAVIVWRVQDAAKAVLEVESYARLCEGAERDGVAAHGERPPLRSGRGHGSREAGARGELRRRARR